MSHHCKLVQLRSGSEINYAIMISYKRTKGKCEKLKTMIKQGEEEEAAAARVSFS